MGPFDFLFGFGSHDDSSDNNNDLTLPKSEDDCNDDFYENVFEEDELADNDEVGEFDF